MAAEYAIEMRGITKTFGSVVANKDVNLTLRKGEILALLGENGSGKTTLMNMLSGIYQPDSGEILVDGTPVSIRSPLGVKDLAVLTEVTFRELKEEDIRRYMELVNVMDKAGSYAFQEHGEMIISSVRGDTDNVIGLPVREVVECLRSLGY